MALKIVGRIEPTRTTTITVTDLRIDLCTYLELAHYNGKHFLVERSHMPFAVILGIEEYRRPVAAGENR